MNKPGKFWIWSSGAIAAVVITQPSFAAEQLYFSYGALERSVPISALETYARTGDIDEDLASYAQYLTPEQLRQFRQALQTPIDLGSVAIAQFLYTPIGENILGRLGQVIQSESRQPGFYGLRAALILAANDPQGLTLLNILKHFPTRGIRIDLERSLAIVGNAQKLLQTTNQAVALVTQQAKQEAASQVNLPLANLPDLRRPGRYTWEKTTFTLSDRSQMWGFLQRDRTFPVDLYLPRTRQPAPVIVISHGLGSDRNTFAYLARHLASYGFAVAVPEHPGSNAQQLQSLASGRTNEVAEPREFLDRPLDIRFLLDSLTQATQQNPRFQGRINLQQVGILGQSFGGYTALALAGAPLDIYHVQQVCPPGINSLNLSLLLQCRATELPERTYNFTDPRIKAAIAINPITSTLFSPASLSQIRTPVMIVGGTADTIAPPLSEQIRPFTWLTTPDRYLSLIGGGTHFSTLAASAPGTDPIPVPEALIGPIPEVGQRYLNALSVAFFGNYLTAQPQFRPYLTAAYMQSLSQAPLTLTLTQSAPLPQDLQAQDLPAQATQPPSPNP